MPYARSPVAFNSFGNDLKEARKKLKISRRKFAEIVDMDWRYLANIENSGFIPSLPLFRDLVVASKLPLEKYFSPQTDKHVLRLRVGQVSPVHIPGGTVNHRLFHRLQPVLAAYHQFTQGKDKVVFQGKGAVIRRVLQGVLWLLDKKIKTRRKFALSCWVFSH